MPAAVNACALSAAAAAAAAPRRNETKRSFDSDPPL